MNEDSSNSVGSDVQVEILTRSGTRPVNAPDQPLAVAQDVAVQVRSPRPVFVYVVQIDAQDQVVHPAGSDGRKALPGAPLRIPGGEEWLAGGKGDLLCVVVSETEMDEAEWRHFHPYGGRSPGGKGDPDPNPITKANRRYGTILRLRVE